MINILFLINMAEKTKDDTELKRVVKQYTDVDVTIHILPVAQM